MTEDDIKKLAEWAKYHKTEVNFNEEGKVSLYADAGGTSFCIDGIKAKRIAGAVVALESFRDAEWTAN